MSNPDLPIAIMSIHYPSITAATIYEDYDTGDLRLAVHCGYLVEEEFEKVIKAYNFIKYGSGPERIHREI